MFIKILKHTFASHLCRHSRFFLFAINSISQIFFSLYKQSRVYFRENEKIFRLIQNVTQEYSNNYVCILVKDTYLKNSMVSSHNWVTIFILQHNQSFKTSCSDRRWHFVMI